MSMVSDQLTALATMSPAQLRAEWRRVCQAQPPPRLTTELLRRGIAYRLQERVHGGLPSHVARELDRLAKRRLAEVAAGKGGGAAAGRCAERDEPRLRPGTRLVRSWQGRTYSVLVTENGFVMDDREYPSLSRIAEAVTGTHWSGPRFFGLTRRRVAAGAGTAAAAALPLPEVTHG